MSDAPDHLRNVTPLWRFSLAYYATKGIPEVLIGLQDKLGIDVNIVLLLLWLASQGRVLGDDDMERIGGLSRGWQETVVSPLREVRRALKTNSPLVEAQLAEPFRTKIKVLELEAEHLQQDALFALAAQTHAGRHVPVDVAVRANLRTYAAFAGCRFPDAALDALLSALQSMPSRS
jgi:uncharacterized protein (TIGR02444 family)